MSPFKKNDTDASQPDHLVPVAPWFSLKKREKKPNASLIHSVDARGEHTTHTKKLM